MQRDSRPDLLAVGVAIERGVLVITLVGEADLSGERLLRDALDQALAHAPGPVVVDLSPLTFCDVRSLTSLLASHAVALTRGSGVALAGMSDLMIRVWQVAFGASVHLTDLPDRYATVEAAIEAAATA